MASEIKKFYKFGDFNFDIQNLHLEHAGEAVRLPPKSLKTLLILLEKRGETVTRESLLENIWAESFVEDANLTVVVSTLRKTLSIYESEGKFIETVPCRGYRFAADAEEKIEIVKQPIVIERHAVEQVTIENATMTGGKFPAALYLLFAFLGLILATGAFAVWQGGGGGGEKVSVVNLSGNPAASEAFLKGDAMLQKRQVCESIPYFREAVSKDENFARAYSSLAAGLAMCEFTNETDEAIAKALALDTNLAEAHATDGFIKMFRHWDWENAEIALRRAVALDPNSVKAHHWLGVLLSIRGRLREAEGELRLAIEIEPNSPLYHADLCQIHYFEIDANRAITECQKAEELDPDFLFTPHYLRDIYLLAGDEQKAWAYEAKDLSNARYPTESIKQAEEVFRREGFKKLYESRIGFFLEHLKNGNADAPNHLHYTLSLADNYALLRDRENALYWLEQSFEGKKRVYPFGVAYLGVDPHYAFLRGDARFQAILQKINL